MKVLLQGHESAKRVELLLSLTRIESENQIKALKLHLTNGASEAFAASTYGVNKSNFSRALKTLNDTAQIVEKIKDIDSIVIS